MVPHPLFWKHWYRRHNAYVRSIIPKSQLLEYRITEVKIIRFFVFFYLQYFAVISQLIKIRGYLVISYK